MAGQLTLLDLRPAGYSFSDGVDFLTALSEEGRFFYLHVWFPLDMVFLTALSVVGLRSYWIMTEGRNVMWRVAGMVLAPAYAVADVAENIAVAGIVIAGARAPSPADIHFASQLTQIKFVIFGVGVGAMILGAFALWRRTKAEK